MLDGLAAAAARDRLRLLAALVRDRHATPDPLVAAAAHDPATPKARVARVAADLGVTERTLHRRTLAAVGYSPKILARVLRLRRLSTVGGTLADRALTAGYAGQAHMSDEVPVPLLYRGRRQRRSWRAWATRAEQLLCQQLLPRSGTSSDSWKTRSPARPSVRDMSIDLPAAERFVYASARLLDRHRAAVLLHDAPAAPVLAALRPYRNADGGYGHALEPDARGPRSETTAALHALEVLAEVDALADPLADVSAWVASVAEPDGGVPFVLPSAAAYPLAPWMVDTGGGSHLTFGLAALLGVAGATSDWLSAATAWCWRRLERPKEIQAYWLKFALDFLDRTAEADRAAEVIETLRPLLRPDGSVPVGGGADGEQLTALAIAPRPDARSRALFTADQIELDLDRLAAGQQADGGWTFDWAAWAPAQASEWRGLVTLRALLTLHAHGRLG